MNENKGDPIRSVIQSCFNTPQLSLGGTSEVNCQIKMVFLSLWVLGWDPVHQLFLNFQIAKEHMRKSSRMASAAVDIVAATQEGIYLVCEVKYWNSPSLAGSIGQVREYQEALNAPNACLTNGKRWIVFDKNNENPSLDENFLTADQMLSTIKDWISPQAITIPSPYPYLEAFELGIATAKKKKPIRMFDKSKSFHISSLWDLEKYPNPIVKQFMQGMYRLSQKESTTIRRDEGTGSVSLKDRRKGKKLIEYNPLTNMIVNTFHDHDQLGIPTYLSREYHSALKKYGRPLTNPEGIISYLRTMVQGFEKV